MPLTHPRGQVRIVHAIRSTDPSAGGPPRSTIDMVAALHRRGHDSALITLDVSGVPAGWGQPGMPGVYQAKVWPHPRGALTPEGRRIVHAALRGADFLHLHEVWEVLNVQLASIARDLGIPYCLSPRGSLDDWGFGRKRLRKRAFHALLARRMMERASFVHCTADGERDQSQVWYPRGRTVIIPNLLDMSPYAQLPGPEAARAEYGLLPSRPVILYLSRICEGKGLEFLVSAMPAILRERPEALLVVAGSGDAQWEDRIRAQVRQIGIEDDARFLGFVGGRMKASLMQAATAFVLPSSHENFGNVLFEAAACGCPLVITRHVATWRELNAAGIARVVAQSPEELAEAILDELASEEGDRADRRASIRKWTLDFFGGDRIIELYERHYGGTEGRSPASGGAKR